MYVTSLKPMLGYFFPVQSLGSPRNPSTDNLIYPRLASHTPCREEGSSHAATIELLLQQKLAVTNDIRLIIII